MSYIWQFFFAQPVFRMAVFLRYVVVHRLVACFIKSVHQNVILSQNTLSQNKVKIKQIIKSQIIFFRSK